MILVNGTKWYVLIAALIASVVLTLPLTVPVQADSTAQETPPVTPPTEPPSARRGQAIYRENCAPCHGDTGLGNGPSASDLQFPPTQFVDAATARQATLAGWFDVTRNGRMERMMPPWGSRLSDQEIWDAVAFAWVLHLEPGEMDQGKEIYRASCASCHGEGGRGDGPQAPPNTPDLTDPERALGRSLAQGFDVLTAGRGGMPAFADTLNDDQRWAVLEYVRSFAYQPLAAPIFEPGPGVITGIVTNATPFGATTAGITITLHVFDSALLEEIRTFQTTTATDGSYRFEGLPTAADWSYLTTLDYAGVPYASPLQSFPADAAEMAFPIEVYEPTEDPSGIRIERAHWFIEFDPQSQSLLLGEFYILSQAGDRVYVGGEGVAPGRRAVLRFPLPTGYQELTLESEPLGERFFEVNGSLVDTLPLPPGQAVRQVFLSYRYPYQRSRLDFQHALAYPTANLNVLVSDIGVEVTSPQVAFRDRQGISGQQYLNLVGENVSAGGTVTLSFKRLPLVGQTTGVAGSTLPTSVIAGIAAIALAGLLAAVGYLIWRRQQMAASSLAGAQAADADLEAERQRLLLVIARLDDEYTAGEIPEEVYQRERARRKARLLEIMQRLENRR